MIRSFDWRDVGLVKTLADRGICLDSETGLTQGNHPLQHALLAYLMPMAGAPTLIWRADGNHQAAFGQLRHRPGEGHARVLYIAPAAGDQAAGWQHVIERLAVEAGERRAQNLIAEVNEKSPEFETLRQTGFAIYARQRIWRQEPARSPAPRGRRRSTTSTTFPSRSTGCAIPRRARPTWRSEQRNCLWEKAFLQASTPGAASTTAPGRRSSTCTPRPTSR